jgi:hypothetical protein
MTSTVVDIETAFLHGDLDEEIYMEAPKGLEIEDNKKLMCKNTIYGLVQSARMFYEKLINVLKIIGFYGSKSDTRRAKLDLDDYIPTIQSKLHVY